MVLNSNENGNRHRAVGSDPFDKLRASQWSVVRGDTGSGTAPSTGSGQAMDADGRRWGASVGAYGIRPCLGMEEAKDRSRPLTTGGRGCTGGRELEGR